MRVDLLSSDVLVCLCIVCQAGAVVQLVLGTSRDQEEQRLSGGQPRRFITIWYKLSSRLAHVIRGIRSLSDEILNAVGHFYLVSMPREVKWTEQRWSC